MKNDQILVAFHAISNRHKPLKLSLRGLAKLLGVSAAYLTRIANGERPPVKKLADASIWIAALSAKGVPANDLRQLEMAVKNVVDEAIERPSQRKRIRSRIELTQEIERLQAKIANDASVVGPARDRFAGSYASIPVATATAALEAGLSLSAKTDGGGMVDAGTDGKAVVMEPKEYYVECRGGGHTYVETVSSNPREIALHFVRLVGGSATMNAIRKSVRSAR